MRKTLTLLVLFCTTVLTIKAQKTNWQNLDLKTDSAFGISTEKAYTELLKGKKHQTVLVAVIDDGVDTAHEDLKAVIWNNPKAKNNGDHPGDRHGWNFIGSAKGNVNYDNLELTRLVRQQSPQFAGKDSNTVVPADKAAFRLWFQEKKELEDKLADAKANYKGISGFKTILDTISKRTGKDQPGYSDFEAYVPRNANEEKVRKVLLGQLQHSSLDAFEKDELAAPLDYYKEQMDYALNVDFDPRNIVGDNYSNPEQHNYGNDDVTGPDAHHGTHVAGIIAAVRDNNIGIKGVANDVRIMSVRVVPNGDERDKDVANGIRYAAEHGAKVINMSFGKDYSPYKSAVDEAVKYALSKDVLLISSAGNDNKDIDRETDYPNRVYADGSGEAKAWIVVGASGFKDDETLKASFSNYGKTSVDVFAPGVKINSSIPGNKYAEYDGTSMATPVVVGLAALIREYYPKLTAIQVKDIILQSVVKVDHAIQIKMGKDTKEVPFSDLCTSGGIVSAYQALLLASHYKNN